MTLLSSTAESPIPLNEIALRTGLNKSTCAHILEIMCDSQYVERISRKDGYRLGPLVLHAFQIRYLLPIDYQHFVFSDEVADISRRMPLCSFRFFATGESI